VTRLLWLCTAALGIQMICLVSRLTDARLRKVLLGFAVLWTAAMIRTAVWFYFQP
jgi:hypothetical protein